MSTLAPAGVRLKTVLKHALPDDVYQRLWQWTHRPRPLDWGDLRRLTPMSRMFGFDRGQCIDRYYIERFLEINAGDIRDRVLEVAEATYSRQFGGDRVTRCEVLHVTADNPAATIVGDLETGVGIPDRAFNCIILTQTLSFIYDMRAAIRTCYRALETGGVLLATFPGISQISRYDMDRWGDYWRVTDASASRLFKDVFGQGQVTVTAYGNILVACAFLHGLATHELAREALDHIDPDYQLLITVRAVKGPTTTV